MCLPNEASQQGTFALISFEGGFTVYQISWCILRSFPLKVHHLSVQRQKNKINKYNQILQLGDLLLGFKCFVPDRDCVLNKWL